MTPLPRGQDDIPASLAQQGAVGLQRRGSGIQKSAVWMSRPELLRRFLLRISGPLFVGGLVLPLEVFALGHQGHFAALLARGGELGRSGRLQLVNHAVEGCLRKNAATNYCSPIRCTWKNQSRARKAFRRGITLLRTGRLGLAVRVHRRLRRSRAFPALRSVTIGTGRLCRPSIATFMTHGT